MHYITLCHAHMFFSFQNFGICNKKNTRRGFFKGQESSVPWKFRQQSLRISPRLLIELLQNRGASALSPPICLSVWACRPRLDEVQGDGWRCELRVYLEILAVCANKKVAATPPGNPIATEFIRVEMAGRWGFLSKMTNYCAAIFSASSVCILSTKCGRVTSCTATFGVYISTENMFSDNMHLHECWYLAYCTAVHVQHCWAELYFFVSNCGSSVYFYTSICIEHYR